MSDLVPPKADLSPAKWIWLPSQRTLPNTFVLFSRTFTIDALPTSAKGWLSADSRYLLTVNGERVQWGPAPADPRWWDADPFDVSEHLHIGENVVGVEVLFYGHGDGTWPIGKPGFLFRMDVEHADGRSEVITSDESWQCLLDRAHKPGQFRRWYLRSLQEEFDARLHPYGWDKPGFASDPSWLPAMSIGDMADKPPMCTWYGDYINATEPIDPSGAALLERRIPPMHESMVSAKALASAGAMRWKRDPSDWFEYRTPGCFDISQEPVALQTGDAEWTLPEPESADSAFFLTFEFAEQIIGWPCFTIDASEGTIVELMVQEAHDPQASPWMDNHLFAWSRFICREGANRFEAFDFESLRWMQLHVRNARRPVAIREVGVRRRMRRWPNEPHVCCAEPALQRLFDASINTLHNCAQETVMDGVGRERQQYSGDCSHQLQAIYYTFGDAELAARFLRTFSEGQLPDGYFLDCWPAYDRLSRLSQRHVGATRWGPILDHSVQFVFDCWGYYMQTGDIETLRTPYERILRFADYLMAMRRERGRNGLLPVENADLGMPSVWIDHDAYQMQRHKQCAFNLYAAGMYRHALAPLMRLFGDSPERHIAEADEIESAAVRAFWSPGHRSFVNNLPWLAEEGKPRMCDRSLATAILFDQCPDGDVSASLTALLECPPEMGLSYPCNAGWRYWALSKLGRTDMVLHDFRTRWATMSSVALNNTLQEMWHASPDGADEWSHCDLSPLYILYMSILGIRPTAPGWSECEIRPQLWDLGDIDVTAHTPRGPIHFLAERLDSGHRIAIDLPAGIRAELVVTPYQEAFVDWEGETTPCSGDRCQKYRLPAGRSSLVLARTNAYPA